MKSFSGKEGTLAIPPSAETTNHFLTVLTVECASHAGAFVVPSMAWDNARAKLCFAQSQREHGSRTPKSRTMLSAGAPIESIADGTDMKVQVPYEHDRVKNVTSLAGR